MMRLPKQDIVATVLVVAAGLLYLLWVLDAGPLGSSTRATGLVVLGLGFAASASAVVPNFDRLLHGSRLYLTVTSLIGMVALIAGVHMLLTANGTTLGLLMATMGALWLIATIHHSRLASHAAAVPNAQPAPVTTGGGSATSVA
jgi:hypothetical protein